MVRAGMLSFRDADDDDVGAAGLLAPSDAVESCLAEEPFLSLDDVCSTLQLPSGSDPATLLDAMPIDQAVARALRANLRWSPPGYAMPADEADAAEADGRAKATNGGGAAAAADHPRSLARQLGCTLHPLRTDGDGDCLLHAVSLAIWGAHDRQQALRQRLAILLTEV